MERNHPSAEQCLQLLLEQDAHPSDAQVDSICEEYPESAEELRQLVAAHRSACALLTSRRVQYSGGLAARESAKKSAFRVQAGADVGDYRLLSFVARGGMGEVWEAEQLSVGRRVALKLILPERISQRGLGMFAREARAAGRLSHPGIASVYDAGEDEGLHWIAMEFVPGGLDLKGQLEALRSEEEIPERYHKEVVRFVAQLADALEHAHQANVIHRDLKPQNILIAEDGTPKLTDFGLAKITDEADLSRTGDFAGTYFYMSPEQVAAKRMGIDHRTDIFSLGVLLYEMLSLRRPFEGDTVQQIAMKILTKEPLDLRTLRSRIPRDLAVIVQKALEKDREKRYQTMGELAADLRRHLANEPIVARPPGPLGRAWKWLHRNPGKGVAAVAAAATFVLISGLWFSAQRSARDADLQKQVAVTQRNGVLGLSAFRDLEQLESRAAELWPPHPEHLEELRAWVEEATSLTASLDRGDDDYPGHRQMLATLEAKALEPTGEERTAERLTHPRYPELADLEARLAQQERVAAVLRGESEPESYQLTEAERAMSPTQLNTLAWSLVQASRKVIGEEARGLALARHGYDTLGDGVGHAVLLHTVAWGLAGVGLDEEARETAARAVEEATEASLADAQRGQALLLEQLDGRETQVEETRTAIAELEEVLGERRVFTFEDERDAWWRSQLVELIGRLEAFNHPKTGLAASEDEAVNPAVGWGVGRRLAMAEMLAERYAEGGDWAERWDKARVEVLRSEHYDGLDLSIQTGLVPIGVDPRSELHEFWHVGTGTEPQRGEDGVLLMEETSGVVLVLIPRTTFWMGAQREDPEKPNYDPAAEPDESPVHEVELSPYFISKFEMTQGQWLHITGYNPAYYRPPQEYVKTLLHPVEQVNWNDCMEWLPRAGLTLPSEAQWECAARSGANTPWWTGEDRSLLAEVGGINIADQAAARIGAKWPQIADWPELDDGLIIHGPAGCTAPNFFGLHEVHGNVYEWCLDNYDGLFYRMSPRVDPLRTDPTAPHMAMRGGGFGSNSGLTRASYRVKPRSATNADNGVGFRPARPVND